MTDKHVSEMTEPGGVYQDANGTPWRRTGDGRWIVFGHAAVYPDNAPPRPLRKMAPEAAPRDPRMAHPVQLGVRCDAPGCFARFEGDFLVAEDSTRDERLAVVLRHVQKHGWHVTWHEPAEDSVTYCPHCARAGAGRVD